MKSTTSSPPPNPPHQKRTAQACSACKRRKVRCTGQQPCEQCRYHSLPCVYTSAEVVAAGRSRLQVAGRGSIIAESRELQPFQFQIPSDGGGSPSLLLPPPSLPRSSLSSSPPASSSLSPLYPVSTSLPDASRYDRGFFYSLLPYYMDKLYPLAPIVDEAELRTHIETMDTDCDAAALVYSSAASTVFLIQTSKPWRPDFHIQFAELLALAIENHKPLELDSQPSLRRVLSCVFLEIGTMGLNRRDLSFFYLRETISLMFMQGLDLFLGSAAVADPVERARRERVYWACFIHERHLAVEASTAICLDPLPSLPDEAYSASNTVGRGWNYIIRTWLLVDRDFVAFWTGDRSGLTADWMQTKHAQLTDPSWELEVAMLATSQQLELIITRQWLRTLTWQMGLSRILLSSDASQSEALSLSMPLRLSSQLKACFARMSSQGVVVDGVGLIDKLFEITTTIADVLVALASSPSDDATENTDDQNDENKDETRSSIRDFLFAKRFLLSVPHVKPIHREILLEKVRHVMRLYRDARWNDLFGEAELKEENS